jgi:hypothetical protein
VSCEYSLISTKEKVKLEVLHANADLSVYDRGTRVFKLDFFFGITGEWKNNASPIADYIRPPEGASQFRKGKS